MTDYACAPIDGVEPFLLPHTLKSAMATLYCKATGMSLAEAFPCAVATWDTDWETDPEPRTFEHAKEAVHNDLQYWNEG